MEEYAMESVGGVCISSKAIEVASESFQWSCDLPGVFLEFVAVIQSFNTWSKNWMLGDGCKGSLEAVSRFRGCRTGGRYDVAGLMIVRTEQRILPGLYRLLRQC